MDVLAARCDADEWMRTYITKIMQYTREYYLCGGRDDRTGDGQGRAKRNDDGEGRDELTGDGDGIDDWTGDGDR